MIPPTKLPPAGETEEPQDVLGAPKKDPQATKTTAPMTDDGRKKPFKEVLESTMSAKKGIQPKKIPVKSDDEDDEKISLLDLAAQTKIRESKPRPSITDTAIFYQQPPEEESVDVAMEDTLAPADLQKTLPPKEPKEPKALDAGKKVSAETSHSTHVVASNKNAPAVPESKSKKAVRFEEEKGSDKKVVEGDDAQVAVAASGKSPEPTNIVAPAPPPVPTAVAPVVVAAHTTPTSNAREIMLKLATQMVSEIKKIETPGRTETTFTLKYPPLFEGVQVKITEYDTARKQFNLTFNDLTDPTARSLVESTANQLRLQQSLIDHGYTLRLVTIEPKIPGLQSLESGEVGQTFQGRAESGQTGSATDQEEGNLT